MKQYFFILPAIGILLFGSKAVGQTAETSISEIIEQLNAQTQAEEGCDKQKLTLNDCTVSYLLTCGGKDMEFSFKLKDIGRVYKEKADFEDKSETIFFECKKGKSCIKNNAEGIPDSPVFPVKLPQEEQSTLGEEALKAFEALLESCK